MMDPSLHPSVVASAIDENLPPVISLRIMLSSFNVKLGLTYLF